MSERPNYLRALDHQRRINQVLQNAIVKALMAWDEYGSASESALVGIFGGLHEALEKSGYFEESMKKHER